MSRRVGVVCAGVLLLATGGCWLDGLRVPFLGPPRSQLVVDGARADVSARLQVALSEAGISVLTKYQGEEFRIAGKTKADKVFCFHLTKEGAEGQEKTRVVLQWDRSADEEFWRTVVLPLAKPAAE
jgi:hypothetical protein